MSSKSQKSDGCGSYAPTDDGVEIQLTGSTALLTVSLWVRNLFDEQHLVARSYSVGSGVYGYFNDPRTFGVQGNVKF